MCPPTHTRGDVNHVERCRQGSSTVRMLKSGSTWRRVQKRTFGCHSTGAVSHVYALLAPQVVDLVPPSLVQGPHPRPERVVLPADDVVTGCDIHLVGVVLAILAGRLALVDVVLGGRLAVDAADPERGVVAVVRLVVHDLSARSGDVEGATLTGHLLGGGCRIRIRLDRVGWGDHPECGEHHCDGDDYCL